MTIVLFSFSPTGQEEERRVGASGGGEEAGSGGAETGSGGAAKRRRKEREGGRVQCSSRSKHPSFLPFRSVIFCSIRLPG